MFYVMPSGLFIQQKEWGYFHRKKWIPTHVSKFCIEYSGKPYTTCSLAPEYFMHLHLPVWWCRAAAAEEFGLSTDGSRGISTGCLGTKEFSSQQVR